MRSRCTLHKTKLTEFQKFCEEYGWRAEPTKGPYEVLRMRHSGCKDPMIVHGRNSGDHFTTWGESARMVRQYIRSKRHESPASAKQAAHQDD